LVMPSSSNSLFGGIVHLAQSRHPYKSCFCARPSDYRQTQVAFVPDTWLVLPTYKERENLCEFVSAVVPRLEQASASYRVLIVDDCSPDGTGKLADQLASKFSCVEVLHRRKKEGLGRAYLAGFQRALDGGAVFVLQMDADFSHDPRDIPRLVSACEQTDLVVGSRYVRGGAIANWRASRRALSRLGSLYSRKSLGVDIYDLTGGFKCIHRRVLTQLDLSQVLSNGYGFQVELTYRAIKAGFGVREIPITFTERETGTSKMTVGIALEAVWKVPALRYKARNHRLSASAQVSSDCHDGQ
jgi:dolichol-phosphate mannosyltransferase